MEEADRYKQRLEAIAEKRRLQEEQDRAKREMEDEKLRLQQLKRKSLRDQWLMEGAPLSPTSLDTQNLHSPLWGTQAQEIEKRIDKFQSESQRLAEEEEKLKEQMEDSQTEAAKVAEAGAEIVYDAVVQNGENGATGLDKTEDEVKTNQSRLLDVTAAVLTNGRGDLETDTSHHVAKQSNQSSTNGPVVASDGVVSMNLELGMTLGVSDAEPRQDLNINIHEDEEEEEGTLVMRAERVIITDEGDDVPEDQEDQQQTMSEEVALQSTETGQAEGEESVEEVVKPESAPEMFTQPEKSEATEAAAEAQPAAADGSMHDGMKTSEDRDTETTAEGQDKQLEELSSVQSPLDATEGITMASVPVYPESALTPDLEAEVTTAVSLEEAEAAPNTQDPVILPGHFQEVPLADPQKNQRTEAGPGEQEPLLLQAKTPNTSAESAAANSPADTETHSPGQGTEAPKSKTCKCCSVM